MTMANWETTFVKIIREICDEERIALTSFDDWAFCLERDGRHKFIYGYQFPVDDAATAGVLKDKAAAAALMGAAGIPCIPHYCVMNPRTPEFCTLDSGWEFMTEKLREWGSMVVKDNQGTGGREVYHVKDMRELEQAASVIFERCTSLAVSPYVEIADEYRVIMYKGEPQIVFVKERPTVTGDGVSSVQELFADALRSLQPSGLKGFMGISLKASEMTRVPEKGERVTLMWKHNLGQGSKPLVLNLADVPSDVLKVARGAAEYFNLGFSSVDVCTSADGAKIMEINGGVMMENLAQNSPEYYELAKGLYRKVILESLSC